MKQDGRKQFLAGTGDFEKGKNASPVVVPPEASPMGDTNTFELFSDSNFSSRPRNASNAYAPDPLYASSYPASSSREHTTSASAVAKSTRDSDIFTEFGSAVVGLFGAKPAAAPQSKSTQSTSLQKALDSQLNEEVGNRSSRRSDGQPLIAL